MDSMIRGFINQVAINPNMVKVLVEGEINDEYIATLHKFDAQLDFVSQDVENVELHVTTSEVKAVKEVRSDLNILKSQCGARVRDYLLGIVHKITAESNLEELQNSELLGTAEITLFLKKHIPKTFEEIKRQYVGLVKEIMMNRVKSYRELYQNRGNSSPIACSRTKPPSGTPKIRSCVVRSFLKKKVFFGFHVSTIGAEDPQGIRCGGIRPREPRGRPQSPGRPSDFGGTAAGRRRSGPRFPRLLPQFDQGDDGLGVGGVFVREGLLPRRGFRGFQRDFPGCLQIPANADPGVVREFGGLRGRFAGGDAHPINCDAPPIAGIPRSHRLLAAAPRQGPGAICRDSGEARGRGKNRADAGEVDEHHRAAALRDEALRLHGGSDFSAGRKIPRIFARSEQMGAAARWINRGSDDADAENERVRGGRQADGILFQHAVLHSATVEGFGRYGDERGSVRVVREIRGGILGFGDGGAHE
ncbi:uncharacterized protein [Blastocystis hominis]|uniref:Vps52 coiled-coil domain-containing protein n=1 Tax=Blastocystis hominis TaxID=12968 RepID=D8LV25_BLAHO|nr:uncharacterized protein [Blastocystis hominis]CBK19664.2 unnamed protein product [Blastocystis hominis]|eukprot:XP_012893712.1 uncharacterized protein [Blastocystis hominis]